MITHKERIIGMFQSLSLEDIRSAYIYTVLARKEEKNSAYEKIISDGFVELSDGEHDGYITPGGREVYKFADKYFTFSDDLYYTRLENLKKEAAERALSENTKVVADTVTLSSIQCPSCHDSMEVVNLCTKCAAFLIGYRFEYNCTCGVSFITKERIVLNEC